MPYNFDWPPHSWHSVVIGGKFYRAPLDDHYRVIGAYMPYDPPALHVEAKPTRCGRGRWKRDKRQAAAARRV